MAITQDTESKFVTLPATAPVKDILEVLHRDGVIVLSDYCSEDEVDQWNAKAEHHFAKAENAGRDKDSFFKGFRASHTTAAYDLIGSCPEEVSKILQRKVWHQVMEEFLAHEMWDWLGEEKVTRKSGYWLHTSIGYKVGPGAGLQVLHRDINSTAIQRTGPESWVNGVSTFVAGCDVTADNGGTHVAPGSHLWPQDRAPKQEDCVAVEMKKGSLAIWLSSIFHGAGANILDPSHPDAFRTIYGFFACSDNFRQGEITALACKPEDFMKMPPEVLRLLGFYKGRTGGGALAGRDPIETWSGLQGYNGGEWKYQEE
nr:uncharacterized protein CI109_006429 [Kwoniella shandongensis]KAA5525259.1 hypothetical protein CI109_006429 [Kwoniella shandongensis]